MGVAVNTILVRAVQTRMYVSSETMEANNTQTRRGVARTNEIRRGVILTNLKTEV